MFELLGAFLGALAAARISADWYRVPSGLIVGLATVGSLNNWATFDHPMWFMAGQLVGYPLVLMAVWVVARGWAEGGDGGAAA